MPCPAPHTCSLPPSPQLITHKVKAFSDPGFWEYLGKNIAMRRACGQYQLVTNPDAWLSEGFWQMVEARAFKPSMYYRMGRIETKAMPEGSLTWWVPLLCWLAALHCLPALLNPATTGYNLPSYQQSA